MNAIPFLPSYACSARQGCHRAAIEAATADTAATEGRATHGTLGSKPWDMRISAGTHRDSSGSFLLSLTRLCWAEGKAQYLLPLSNTSATFLFPRYLSTPPSHTKSSAASVFLSPRQTPHSYLSHHQTSPLQLPIAVPYNGAYSPSPGHVLPTSDTTGPKPTLPMLFSFCHSAIPKHHCQITSSFRSCRAKCYTHCVLLTELIGGKLVHDKGCLRGSTEVAAWEDWEQWDAGGPTLRVSLVLCQHNSLKAHLLMLSVPLCSVH